MIKKTSVILLFSTVSSAQSVVATSILSNVSELKDFTGNDNYVYVKGYYTPEDGGGGVFKNLISSKTENGGTIFNVSGSPDKRWVRQYKEGEINAKWFGAIGNGIADDTKSIKEALKEAEEIKKAIYLPNDHDFKVTPKNDEVLDIRTSVYGGGKISNVKCRFYRVKDIIVDDFKCDDLLISGAYFCDFRKIMSKDFTLDGGEHTEWGVFWNKFGNIQCDKLVLDCDKDQSINQNIFISVVARKGLHIIGTKEINNSGPAREAHNNVFHSLDTTGADGIHISNTSVSNQTNTIHMWYAERTGSKSIEGNWHVLGSNIDSDGGHVRLSDRSHYLFSGTQTQRNDGDFFAGGTSNLAVGGEWEILDQYWEKPLCLTYSGNFENTTKFENNCPSGITKQFAKETTDAGQFFQINFDFDTPKNLTICLWYQGNDFQQIYSDGGDGSSNNNDVYITPGYYTHSSGWKLLRFSIQNVKSWVRLNLSTVSGYRRVSINSIFATDQKTAFLPTKKEKTYVRGFGKIKAGQNFLIKIPTDGYQMQRQGFAKIYFKSEIGTPFFKGATGSIITPFSKSRYDNLDSDVVISPQKAISSINGGGTTFTVQGNKDGINITAPDGINDIEFNYELEILE